AEKIILVKEYESNKRSAVSNGLAAAEEAFVAFLTSPFGRHKYMYNVYTPKAKQIYDDTIDLLYFSAIVPIMNNLYAKISNRIAIVALPAAIKALNLITTDLSNNEQVLRQTDPGARVGSLDDLYQQIQQQYTANNNEINLRNTTMDAVCDVVLADMDEAAAATYHMDDQQAAERISEKLQALIDNTFATLNSLSLQQQMNVNGATTAQAQTAYAQNVLAPMLERGAGVLFAADPGTQINKETAVMQTYVSIPIGQPSVKAGIQAYITNTGSYNGAVFKNSAIADRVFWLNIASCLALSEYAFMSDYEKAYDANRHRHGLHLLQNITPTIPASAQNEWSLLPSPYPFMLMYAGEPVEKWNTRRQTQKDLLDQAEANGLLILYTPPGMQVQNYTADFVVLTADNHNLPLRADTLKPALKQLIEQNPTIPNDVASWENRRGALAAWLSNHSARVGIGFNARYLTLEVERFCNDQRVPAALIGAPLPEGAPPQVAAARLAGFQKCFRALVQYRIAKRPMVLDLFRQQLPLAQEIQDVIRECDEKIAQAKHDEEEAIRWKNSVLDEAKNVIAPMLLFDLIKLDVVIILYRNFEGEYTYNGSDNILFTKDNSSFKLVPGSGYLPVIFELTDWYLKQDPNVDPIDVLNKRLVEKQTEISHCRDVDVFKGLVSKAEGMKATYERQEAVLRANQRMIADAHLFAAVLETLQNIQAALDNLVAPYVGL
ncbi:MAG: hypothetical protein RR482_02320, partial [Clostridia bacterium]